MRNDSSKNREELCGEGVRMMGRLAHTIRSLRTWPIDSPAIRFGLNGISAAATNIVGLTEEDLKIVLSGDRVRVGDYIVSPPPGMLSAIRELRDWLRERGVSGFLFHAAPSPHEIQAALVLLRGLDPEEPLEAGVLNSQLAAQGMNGLSMVACKPIRSGLPGVDPDEDPSISILRIYLRGLRGTARLIELGSTPAVILELTRLVQALTDLLMDDARKALVLMGGRGSAPYSQTHPLHRTILALVMGRRLGMREKELLELGMCSLAADFGINRISPTILEKGGGRLTLAEFKQVQRHPLETVQHLLAAGPLSPALRRRLLVGFELRMGFDRSGYPQSLIWPELHPFTRVIALADSYDALRSVRPWRPACTSTEALALLKKGASRQYDPMLVEELDAMLKAYRFEEADA
ncbi:MAG: hypothetical protein P8R54_00410 [Myxococcota bacterium]|nr:hypothetical protein [Myxococcota bacterium]